MYTDKIIIKVDIYYLLLKQTIYVGRSVHCKNY